MNTLTSAAWWKAALIRALRTALVVLAPYTPTVLHDGNYAIVGSVVGFSAVLSLITSLAGIAEVSGKTVTWYYAILERAVKTAAQALITLFGTATMFQQVSWSEAPSLIGTAVLGSLVIAFMGFLPEAKDNNSHDPQVLPPSAEVPVPVDIQSGSNVVVDLPPNPSGVDVGDARDGG